MWFRIKFKILQMQLWKKKGRFPPILVCWATYCLLYLQVAFFLYCTEVIQKSHRFALFVRSVWNCICLISVICFPTGFILKFHEWLRNWTFNCNFDWSGEARLFRELTEGPEASMNCRTGLYVKMMDKNRGRKTLRALKFSILLGLLLLLFVVWTMQTLPSSLERP